jgi:hypothetical protein
MTLTRRDVCIVFLEVVVDASAAAACGLLSRDEIQDPLSEAMEDSGLGEVVGGGGGSGRYVIDVEVEEETFQGGLDLIRNTLKRLNAPSGTRIKRHKPAERVYTLGDD